MTMTTSDVQKDAVLGKLLQRIDARREDDDELEGDILDALIGVDAEDAGRWYGSGASILESLDESIAFLMRIRPTTMVIDVKAAKGAEQIKSLALKITKGAIARHREDLYPALPGSDMLETIAHWRNADLENGTQEAYAAILAPRPDYDLAALGAGFQVDQDGNWSSRTKEASYGSAEDACLDWDVPPVMRAPIMALQVPLRHVKGLIKLDQRVTKSIVAGVWTIFDLDEAKIAWWTVCADLRAEDAAKAA